MGRPRFPWFKLQTGILSNPKIRELPADLLGHWVRLLALASQSSPRGSLPSDLRLIAEALGRSYMLHMTRIMPRVITPLIQSGLIDRDSTSSHLSMHDFDYWQSSENLLENGPKNPLGNPAGNPAVYPVGNALSDSKELTPELAVLREKREKEEGCILINRGRNIQLRPFRPFLKILSETASQRSPQKPRKQKDPRYAELKSTCEQSWREHRGSELGSCTGTADWVMFASMLDRTKNDKAFSLSALQSSFMRFCASTDHWDKRQGLRYWASHPERYMYEPNRHNGNGHKSADGLSDRARLTLLRATSIADPESLTPEEWALISCKR